MNLDGSCAPALLRVQRGLCALVAAALCVPFCSPAALGQCQYEVVEPIIQGPNCQFVGPRPTIPLGMNNLGEAVGYYWDCNDVNINHAFLWKPGEGLTTLPNPPGVTTAFASDINDAGYIIGGHWRTGIGWSGFIRDPDTGEYTYLEALHEGFDTIQTVSTANAINNADPPVVAGSRVVTKPGQSPLLTQAVVWWPFGIDGDDAVVLDLGNYDIGPDSSALRMDKDSITVLGTTGPSSNPLAFVHDLSGDLSFVVGEGFGLSSSTMNGFMGAAKYAGTGAFMRTGLVRAFVVNQGIIINTIDPLPGYTYSAARSANVLGQVLVRSQTPGDKAGIWQNGVHTSLDDLVIGQPNLQLRIPQSTDGSSHILCRAIMGSKTVGVLLTPVDRPLTDLNADCQTDVLDLLMLLKSWGPCNGDECTADFTGNGVVGVPDLLVLLSNWG